MAGPTGKGSTELIYNINGHIASTYDSVARVTNTFTTTATGLVLHRARNGSRNHFFYYADDQRIGDVSDTPDEIQRVSYAEQLAMKTAVNKRTYYRNVWDDGKLIRTAEGRDRGGFVGHSTADFDQNYEPINDNYPGSAASNYTVRYDGETLRSVAQTLWGDGAMWYLIAESNGYSADTQLKAGQLLVIPNKVTNIHNNSSTWRPYNAGEAIGQTDPTLPTPKPPKKGCGAIGTLIMVVVAVVATVFTAGAATVGLSAGFSSIMGAGATVLTGGVVAAGTAAGFLGGYGLAAAALGGAVGSVASQLVGMATGNVDKFSWKAVGQSALGSFVTAGVGSALSNVLPAVGGTPGALNAAGRAAIGTGATMALRGEWNWRSVMVSALSAGVGNAVGQAVNGTAFGDAFNGLGKQFTGGMAGALVARSLSRGPKVDYSTVFASTLGNALGSSLADSMRADDYSAWGKDDTETKRLLARYPGSFSGASQAQGAANRAALPDWAGGNDFGPSMFAGVELGERAVRRLPLNGVTATSPSASPVLHRDGPFLPVQPGIYEYQSGINSHGIWQASWLNYPSNVALRDAAGNNFLPSRYVQTGEPGGSGLDAYGAAVQDAGVADRSFLKYAWGGTIRAVAAAGNYVRGAAVGAWNNPADVWRGVQKSVVNFGPELFNGAVNLTKASLNGWSLIAEQFGAGDGAFAGFRASNPYNIQLLSPYRNSTQSLAGVLSTVGAGFGVAKFGGYGLALDDVSALGHLSQRGAVGLRVVMPGLNGNARLLAANMGVEIPQGYAAHHRVMSSIARESEALRHLGRNGLYDVNRGSNGLALPTDDFLALADELPLHRGFHGPDYRMAVRQELQRLDTSYRAGATDVDLLLDLAKMESSLGNRLSSGKLWLNHADAALRGIGPFRP